MNPPPEAISIPPRNNQPPRRILVALHGWGANGEDLASLAPLLALEDCQMLFPHAPFAHPRVPGGRMWYNLETAERQGLAQSRQQLLDWLKSLEGTTGVPLTRTVLSGFSQGGAMTLDVGLQLPLAGLCVLSGYLHSEPTLGQTYPPILMVHGKQDPVVPLRAAQQAHKILTGLGATIEYHEFNMQHEIQMPVVELLQKFIVEKTS